MGDLIKLEDVKKFLDQLKSRLSIMGGTILCDNRDKNVQFMTEMNWVGVKEKKEWLLKLEPNDYYEGPKPNEKPGLEPYWVFGKRIEGKLCYIKVFLYKKPNVYCISFHFAEHDMFLPLKGITETI